LSEYEAEYGADKNYIPPVALTYWSFRLMVGAGFLMLALAAYALFLLVRKMDVLKQKRYLRLLPFAIFLPYIANTFGWIMTEIGRQPWIVFGLQRTEDAVSPNVSTGMVALSLVAFVAIYGILMVADVFLLMKFGKMGPTTNEPVESAPSTLAAAGAAD
jgi:cytochrome bd ubiquinol oxidase subunit I